MFKKGSKVATTPTLRNGSGKHFAFARETRRLVKQTSPVANHLEASKPLFTLFSPRSKLLQAPLPLLKQLCRRTRNFSQFVEINLRFLLGLLFFSADGSKLGTL
mmetsp:Transcript_9227/g.20790  ORF Transcript_9227/g.20790 Transcript_9227/m.20790 type:complete len:104 (-) Transcript_9227:1291-1602(-)